MADLISQGTWDLITSALRDVTDTFLKHPVTYKRLITSLDRFNEDRQGDNTYAENVLVALVEWPIAENKNSQSQDGAVRMERVKVTFDMFYLNEQGLVSILANNTWRTVFNSAKDYLFISGFHYKLDQIYYDGQLQDRHKLCIVEGVIDTMYKGV